jgi:hypothetical protein
MRTENANLHPILQRWHNSGAARGLPGLYGGFVQSIGGKDRRAVMRNLERISKAMTFDGVSASSTTSAKSGLIITNGLQEQRPERDSDFRL